MGRRRARHESLDFDAEPGRNQRITTINAGFLCIGGNHDFLRALTYRLTGACHLLSRLLHICGARPVRPAELLTSQALRSGPIS